MNTINCRFMDFINEFLHVRKLSINVCPDSRIGEYEIIELCVMIGQVCYNSAIML